ncbi:CBS domain-containing protein [Methylobacterium sp. SyP6R]|uniref:CBS domain-containing protein n=1 Tax=Methylobacterium sp. SyP6R TaxID=2718876 RepID=UPI001F48CEED|nr:CBS domain-containing protein [Methylobacterium sp. SyP6R]MCF4129866.1 CBS domain-containing protein [Methylobacterium sp. SyP6R]
MIVRDVMTREVATVQDDAAIEAAIALMLERRVSGLPVLDRAGALVGLVSEGDFLRRRELDTAPPQPGWIQYIVDPGRLAETYAREHGRGVSDVMTRALVTVSPEATLAEAAALMARHRIRRLPVVAQGRLAGIVARADLLRALHAALGRSRATTPSPSARSDAEIRATVEAAIAETGLFPAGRISVAVVDGTVTLHGTLVGERQRAAIRAAAESVSGVQMVRDGLASIDARTNGADPPPGDGPDGGVRAA